MVADHTLHTVAFDAVQVTGQQHIGDDGGFVFGKAKGRKSILTEGV